METNWKRKLLKQAHYSFARGLCIIIIIDGEVVCCECEAVRCESDTIRCEGYAASDLQGHRRNGCDCIVTLSMPTFSSLTSINT